MKTHTALAAILIATLNGLVLVPALQAYGAYLIAGSIALALWLLLKALFAKPGPATPAPERAPEPTPTPAPTVAPEPASTRQAEAQVLAVLGAFQAKGRLIDFLKDDVAAYSDAQVGAAARVVQQGCKAALDDLFEIAPVSTEREGSLVTVPEGAPSDEYRLAGKVSGAPPFRGTLTHKGWKATRVKLPRVLAGADDRLPPIAPAQVELK